MPLNTFTRHPHRALKDMGTDGLTLTRPGEPDLILSLAADKPGTVTTEPDGEKAAAERPGSGETPITAAGLKPTSADEVAALGMEAIMALPREAFDRLIVESQPWMANLPDAGLRMALQELDAARSPENATIKDVADVITRWKEKAAPYQP